MSVPLPAEAEALLPPGPRAGPDSMTHDRLAEEMATAEGLLCSLVDLVDRSLIDRSPRLRVVSQMAVGVDNVDLEGCTARGIPVGHTPDVLTETTADTAVALLLAVVRRLPEGRDLVRSGEWRRWSLDLLIGSDLHDTTVGIVGLGRIGAAVARRLSGFSVRLLYCGPRRKPVLEAELRAAYRSLENLLAESDHVVLCAPLTGATRRLLNADRLAMMKPTATLVNIARGGLVDHDALARALAGGRLGRAALDVTEPEPLPADHPLVALPNCLIVPHLGSASTQTRLAMALRAVENLRLGLDGERLRWCANPEVYC